MQEKEANDAGEPKKETDPVKQETFAPPILEEITIEELAVDGICGIY